MPPSAGWLASLIFHGALALMGASLLVRSVHFQVLTGKTSTEMTLVAAPPLPAAAPTPSPLPQVLPAVVPPAALAVLPPRPAPNIRETASVPILPLPLPRLKHSTQTPIAKTTRAKSAPAARGAVQARPDDLDNQPPVYPEDSRTAREQGVVILRVKVTAAGGAARVAILKSSGYFRLDESARKAVEGWRFHPALVGDAAIASEVDVPVRFRLQQ